MSEDFVRTIIVCGCGIGIAALALPSVLKAVPAFFPQKAPRDPRPSFSGITSNDMQIVLELADRMRRSGCADGVHLCQQLLDVMLNPKDKTPGTDPKKPEV